MSKEIHFTSHAIERMIERKISREDIARIIEAGEMMEQTQTRGDARRYKGKIGRRTIEIVVKENDEGEPLVVTVIVPE